MSENPAHRAACRRQHRVIANYLALTAWLRGVDCVVLVRADLQKFLGLERFKGSRVQWLRADIKPWFPYQLPYYVTAAPSSIHSLFLSRVDLADYLPHGSMSTDQRITRMPEGSPRTERFSKGSTKVPDEAEIVSRLAVLAAGLGSPQSRRRP